jgi:hypothetical protein
MNPESVFMLNKQNTRAIGACSLILVLGFLAGLYAWAKRDHSQSKRESNPITYRVLKDDMGTKISIGVELSINERQLRATLIKAADDHQRDAARDYLFSDYLWVEAYLLDGKKQSSLPAGKLRRYVPPKDPHYKKADWLDWLPDIFGKKDKFYMTLREAKQTLR